MLMVGLGDIEGLFRGDSVIRNCYLLLNCCSYHLVFCTGEKYEELRVFIYGCDACVSIRPENTFK